VRREPSQRHEQIARRRVRQLRHAGHAVAQVGERGCAARTHVDHDRVEREAEPALLAYHEIRDGSAYVAAALDARKVRLVGAMYDVATGKVAFVEP
jgi:carbonic anhydrase